MLNLGRRYQPKSAEDGVMELSDGSLHKSNFGWVILLILRATGWFGVINHDYILPCCFSLDSRSNFLLGYFPYVPLGCSSSFCCQILCNVLHIHHFTSSVFCCWIIEPRIIEMRSGGEYGSHLLDCNSSSVLTPCQLPRFSDFAKWAPQVLLYCLHRCLWMDIVPLIC